MAQMWEDSDSASRPWICPDLPHAIVITNENSLVMKVQKCSDVDASLTPYTDLECKE